MIREEYLHEMMQLKEIAGHLQRKVNLHSLSVEDKTQLSINKFVDRAFNLLDKMSREYLIENDKKSKRKKSWLKNIRNLI